MAYFLPSFFQKRLLKYALSRLEFVDTEALDPDSLGIRWGQRSTVELRDIGLRLEKIATLLHLPTSSELLSARIRFLKLTIPADIYSSGIICEISGVDVHLRLPSEDEANPIKEIILAGQDPGHDTLLPNPADLAESFLQTEPKEEKEELQAAISTRSQVLLRTSSSISDDEEELGLGNETVSLPGFVAAFLKGIADRLHVLVDDISIRLDVETKQEGSSKRHPEERPDLITGLLSVGQISVGAVATTSTPDVHSLHISKRPVSVSDINLALVSEPIVFSNYSRFAAPVSPATPLPTKSSQPQSPASSAPPAPASVSSSTHAMMESTIFEPSKHFIDATTDKHDVSGLGGSAYTHDGRFSDADTEEENRSYGYLEESQKFSEDEKLLDNPAYLDSVIDSHIQDEDLEGLDETPFDDVNHPETEESIPRLPSPTLRVDTQGTGPRSSDMPVVAASEPNMRSFQSRSPSHNALIQAEEYISRSSMPSLSTPRAKGDAENCKLPQSPSPSTSEYVQSDPGSGSFNDELSESKLFTSEEAQSMYMSAISHGSTSRSFIPNIPGAWDSPESTMTSGAIHHPASADRFELNTLAQDDDETPVSTPKPTDCEELNSLENPLLGASQTLHSEPADGHSIQSSSASNKTTEVVKRFLNIDRVTIWIPPARGERDHEDTTESYHMETASDSFKDSRAHSEFSRIGEKMASSSSIPSSFQPRSHPADLAAAAENTDSKVGNKQRLELSGSENEISVEISSVEIQFDIAIGWLVAKFGQRVFQTFGGNDQTSVNDGRAENDVQDPAIKLALDRFSIKFVEHVPGNPYLPQIQQEQASSFLDFPHDDIILQTSAYGLKAHFSSHKEVTKLSAEISKFTLGFASDDLISFSEELKIRESTRDILSPVDADVSLSLSQSPDSTRFTIATLPLRVNINIQRLEEVLGWFGGLSTILELGSSISSLSGSRGQKKDVPKRARGVHFEGSPPPNTTPQAGSTTWKVDARIGGIALDIAGETHYLMLRTTAAKIVSRMGVVALQIDKAKLSGPLPLDDSRDAPAKVSLNSIRVEFLFTPKERDLDRLLALITPSKDKYEEDDDIMIDTLFRQRKQGSVLRVTVGGAKIGVSHVSGLGSLQQLGEELGRLSNVAKYLPEDDRPGILTLLLIRELEARLRVGGKVGSITAKLEDAEAAHISIPSLVAAQLGSIKVVRNEEEELIGDALPSFPEQAPIPVLMARFIADEMDPTIKVKLHNVRVEYAIPSMTAFLGISDEMTSGDVAANMVSSLANLAEPQSRPQETPSTSEEETIAAPVKPTKLTVAMRDCVLGLNPRGTVARGLIVLTTASFGGTIHDPSSSEATLDLRKAAIMIIDDPTNIDLGSNQPRRRAVSSQSNQIQSFTDMGYVPVSSISSATAIVKIVRLSEGGTKSLDVELRDDLLILETCADSTQTLISIINGLQPPSPPNVVTKYRTEVMPINDMLASFSGDAFTTDWPEDAAEALDKVEIPENDELEYVSDFYPMRSALQHDSSNEGLTVPGSNELADSFHSQYYVSSSVSELEFQDDHFTQQSSVGGTAHRWDSTQNTYGLSDDSKLQKSPLRLRVRDAHVIWNLFDGYDWQRTRDTISKAVKDVEKKASDRRVRVGSRASPGFEEEEAVIGDCLFNSIYIGIPANRDPGELRGDINRNIDDVVSETGSYATTSTVTTVRPNQSPGRRGKKLRLSRSKYHKMTFELKGICADLVIFPPDSGETQNSLDIRVAELEIFDHVPTSTWKKFATYMREAGEKESGTSMVHLEILTVQPVPELAASEIVLKATILPLRLHVDQDALDFLSRFFEFRDDSARAPPGPPQEVPFLQRVEINAVPVKLDFKPKRVDYAGLRSGRTTEFMNFFVLDEADMVMRHVIIYGVSGFDKLGQTLNDIWMPDIKRNQLPSVLSGLAPIRSLVNVGSGVKDLVVVPMREYRKDGRVVRSIQKGAVAFAKTTSNELVKLGAKLAIGTQTVLQGAEELLTTPTGQPLGEEEDQTDDEAAKKISLYADQPVGVVQGLRGAFRGLERDLLLARDAIIAVPGEVAESGSAKAAAKAVWKRTPTVVLRPAIGVSKAVGQTLLGAGNSLDPSNRRKMEDKYKRH
ncbi:putative autophagy regulatory protein Atg2 [Aspergillus lucknowensis]|uniref:Autophagy-related protein 2 n=1 Tax=Aspergillus lucknowensis TaxID=176173 RepID=A0ABR4LZ62_9EURO